MSEELFEPLILSAQLQLAQNRLPDGSCLRWLHHEEANCSPLIILLVVYILDSSQRSGPVNRRAALEPTATTALSPDATLGKQDRQTGRRASSRAIERAANKHASSNIANGSQARGFDSYDGDGRGNGYVDCRVADCRLTLHLSIHSRVLSVDESENHQPGIHDISDPFQPLICRSRKNPVV